MNAEPDLCGNPLCRAVLGHGKDDRNRGLCRPCYKRWQNAGFAGDGPGAPLSRSEAARRLNATLAAEVRAAGGRSLAARRRREREDRVQDFAWCLAGGEIPEVAAGRVRVSPRTGARYRGELRQRRQEAEFLAA